MGPPDAPAHLVELRQSEMIGIIDDDGVRISNVEAVLDDARREQDVVLALVEVHHDALERLLRHLAVGNADAGLRHELLQALMHMLDAVDAVVDEEHLAAALDLALYGAADDGIVVLDDVGLHRESLGRWRLDDAHIARPDERHVQRARDRRSRQGQHVDAGRELAYLVLLLDAEALLLIDDEQAEILEFHAALIQYGMGADEDVDLAARDLGERLALLLGRAEAADDIDARQEIPEPLAERLEMLLREHGRRHEHRDLLAIHGRLVGRPDGDLGLAEADIAAQQAVHGFRLLHIGLDLRYGLQLVVRLLIRERILELALRAVIRRESEALGVAALRVDLDELLGDVLDRFPGACLRLGPFRAAHAMQARHLALGADVFLQLADLVRRHVQLVIAAVFDMQVVAVDAADLERHDAEVFADAVIDMDDIVARLDLTKMADAFTALRRLGAAHGPALLMAEDISLGDNDGLSPDKLEAGRKAADADADEAGTQLIAIGYDARGQPASGQGLTHVVRLCLTTDHDVDAELLPEPTRELGLEQVHLPLERRHARRRDAQRVRQLGAMNLLQHECRVEYAAAVRRCYELVPGEYLALELRRLLQHGFQLGAQARRFVEYNRAAAVRALQIRQEWLRLLAAAVITGQWQHHEALDAAERALRLEAELAQRVDLITEILDAHRQPGIDGEYIDDATAGTELADMLDLIRALIAEGDELADERVMSVLLPRAERQRQAGEFLAAQALLSGSPRCRQHDGILVAHEPPEDLHAPCLTLAAVGRGPDLAAEQIALRQYVERHGRQQRREVCLPGGQRLR